MVDFLAWLVFLIVMALSNIAASAVTGMTIAAMSKVILGTGIGEVFWPSFWVTYTVFGAMVGMMIKDGYVNVNGRGKDDKKDLE